MSSIKKKYANLFRCVSASLSVRYRIPEISGQQLIVSTLLSIVKCCMHLAGADFARNGKWKRSHRMKVVTVVNLLLLASYAAAAAVAVIAM